MRLAKTILLLALIFFIYSCSDKESSLPTPKIEVYETIEQKVPIIDEFVGNVLGQKDIAIRARTVGFLEGIHFNEGRPVKKGQLLIQSKANNTSQNQQLNRVS